MTFYVFFLLLCSPGRAMFSGATINGADMLSSDGESSSSTPRPANPASKPIVAATEHKFGLQDGIIIDPDHALKWLDSQLEAMRAKEFADQTAADAHGHL